MRIFAFFGSDILIRILFRRKSDEAFSIDVNPKRFETGDNYVEAQIELITIEKEWVVDVSGDYTSLSSVYFLQSVGEINASTT